MAPSFPPLQETFVILSETEIAAGWPTLKMAGVMHPLLSVTVTPYAPARSPEISSVVSPFVQENE